MPHQMFVDFRHHVALAEGELLMAAVHVCAVGQQNDAEDCQHHRQHSLMQADAAGKPCRQQHRAAAEQRREHLLRDPVAVVGLRIHHDTSLLG